MNGWRKCEKKCNGILFSPEKEGNPAACDMDEPGGHYAKWKKPDTEKQVLHNLTYMWNLKRKSNL